MSEYMIMLNSVCNLRCPYCFATETMENAPGEIGIDNFVKAVEFALKGTRKRGIGIIGGEPTIHSRFAEMMQLLIDDERIESVDVFSNGTTILSHLPVFQNEKMHILVNCNPPEVMGSVMYQKVLRGIDALFASGVTMDRVGLGINIYADDTDYNYFLSLVDRYHMDSVRISVSVPPYDNYEGAYRFHFFEKYLRKVHDFVTDLLDRGTVPVFDCNKIPPCFLLDEEKLLRQRYQDDHRAMEALSRSNYLNGTAHCTPSIVVDQNLNAIRCFALSAQTRQSIERFETLEDLKRFYADKVDRLGYIADHPDCTECADLEDRRCMGGCMIFKSACTSLHLE